jgi:hypothetical protein
MPVSEDKVYYPETILSTPIPETTTEETTASGVPSSATVSSPVSVAVQFPPRKVARELLSSALNTRSKKILGDFSFGVLGAISIGEYEFGVSGDVRITPNGITARNVNGDTTFSLDGTTGDAVFAGTVQAGSILSGDIDITGTLIINDGTNDIILIGYQDGGF